MDRDHPGLAQVGSHPRGPLGGPDRFADWPRQRARAALALLLALVLIAAFAPGYAPAPPLAPLATHVDAAGAARVEREDEDLKLYRRIIARVRAGDGYYRVAVEEQRRNNYPVRPGLTVRLPTLAFLNAALGPIGAAILRMALLAGLLAAASRRLLAEPDGAARLPMARVLLIAAVLSWVNFKYDVVQEVWAADLMALSFLLYRPERGRWGAAWLAAAAALAVRELVLPYVLFLAAEAAWHRRWRECAAWVLLILAFAAALALHLHLATAQLLPGDPASPSWFAPRGIAGFLYKVNHSSFLGLVPLWLSGPCVVLALFGWASWRTPLGERGFLLLTGYALAFMVVGRDNNFYWGLIVTPLLFMGASFAGVGLPSLLRRAGLHWPRHQVAHA